MITRTFLSKCNTISNNSKENFGLNPICFLNYGGHISRALIYFDTKKLAECVSNGTYKDRKKLRHILRMTNCGSIDVKKFFEPDEARKYLSQRHRATSFDIIAFKVPKMWDAGVGFDDSTDTWMLGYKSVSKDGSTWENSKSGVKWSEPLDISDYPECEVTWEEKEVITKDKDGKDKIIRIRTRGTSCSASTYSGVCNGIYSSDFLWDEYNKWYRDENGKLVVPNDCVVISRQHFDYGNENLELDITDYVNSILFDGARNYGLCLAFSPKLEETETSEDNYITFFTNNTNTFFAPYLETRYNCEINDDRYKFYLGKKNRLYFYAVVNGEFVELDELPTCSINGEISEVFSDSKGIYYTEVKLPKNAKEKAIMNDVWGNIKLDGEELEDVEMEFVTLPYKSYFNFGEDIEDSINLSPVISGVNDDQKLNQGEKRELTVTFRVPYASSEYELVDKCYYRIYAKDGQREIDAIDWDMISVLGKKNLFSINTSELLPQEYYIDIKAIIGRQTLMFKNELRFTIVSNTTNLKK